MVYFKFYFFWSLIKVGIFWGIQNNLRICDSYIIWCCLDIFMAWKFCNFGPGIFLVLFEAQRTFFGFYFCPHSIIPVTWNPEYPLLGATGILIKMVRTEPEKRGLRPKSEKKIQVFEHWQPDGDFLIAANK